MRELGVQIDHDQQRRMVFKILPLTISGVLVSIMWFPVNHWDVELEYGFESVIFTVHFSVIFIYAASLALLLAKRNEILNETFRYPTITSFLYDTFLSISFSYPFQNVLPSEFNVERISNITRLPGNGGVQREGATGGSEADQSAS